MTANHPIITYRLTREGRVPDYLCKHEGSFGGLYGVNTNKPGFMPKWPSPQETLFLGMGDGPIDPDGAPEGVEVIETKQELQDYITGISTTWTVDTSGTTGIRTETTSGTLDSWNNVEGAPGLTTTTTDKVTFAAPSGTLVVHTANYVTEIKTEVENSSGITTSIQTFEPSYPYTNITIVGTTTTVGVATATGMEGELVTTTTTTTTTEATHEDITEGYSDSITTIDTDGQVGKIRTRTFTETTKVRNPFDPIAATNELWAKYEYVNSH